MSAFETVRSTATAWARAYFQAGEAFDFSDHDENQRKAWEGMKAARAGLLRSHSAGRPQTLAEYFHFRVPVPGVMICGQQGTSPCAALRTSMQTTSETDTWAWTGARACSCVIRGQRGQGGLGGCHSLR